MPGKRQNIGQGQAVTTAQYMNYRTPHRSYDQRGGCLPNESYYRVFNGESWIPSQTAPQPITQRQLRIAPAHDTGNRCGVASSNQGPTGSLQQRSKKDC